jgi:hypothetical protein
MPEPPRLVFERSDVEIRKQRTAAEVRSLTRILGANVLRIVGGAGKPSAIWDQVLSWLVACEEFNKAHGRWPDRELKIAFELPSEMRAEMTDSEIEVAQIYIAKHTISVAALRFLAAKLLDQGMQEVAARHQLENAIERLTELKAKRRKGRKRISPSQGRASRKP